MWFGSGADEDREYEFGAQLGDPRRCPRQTSSPDGMFDGLCYRCEYEMYDAWEASQPDDFFGDLWEGVCL